jgi:MFS family permease
MVLLQRTRAGVIEGEVERLRIGRDALRLMRRRNVALITLFAFLATWASVWQVAFLPLYFNKVWNYGVVYAAYLTSIVPISGAAGKIILGRLSDTRNRPRMLAMISTLVVLSYLAFFGSSSIASLILAAVVMSFFSSAVFPIMQALMADSCGGRTGTALGLNTTSQSVAAALSPLITAILFGFGIEKAIAVDAMVPAGVMILVALLLREPRGKEPRESWNEGAVTARTNGG